MNEFEWLKQTRALNRAESPQNDLWPGIAQRIRASAPPARTRRQRALPWAMAAALAALSVLAGTLAWRVQVMPTTPRVATSATSAAGTPWKPRDPRLVGPAIELNLARRQLTLAIRAAPHDAYLQHMLHFTNQQIDQLQQLEHRAG